MGVNLENKKQIVENLKENFKNAKSIVFVDYRGISVLQDTALRKKFREEGISYKVYKNRLMLKALNELNISGIDEHQFEGTTAVAFGNDEVAPARIFCNYAKEIKKMDVKFGIVNGSVFNKNQVEDLSKIPSKPILIAMLLGQLQAPVSAFARALNAIKETK